MIPFGDNRDFLGFGDHDGHAVVEAVEGARRLAAEEEFEDHAPESFAGGHFYEGGGRGGS